MCGKAALTLNRARHSRLVREGTELAILSQRSGSSDGCALRAPSNSWGGTQTLDYIEGSGGLLVAVHEPATIKLASQ